MRFSAADFRRENLAAIYNNGSFSLAAGNDSHDIRQDEETGVSRGPTEQMYLHVKLEHLQFLCCTSLLSKILKRGVPQHAHNER